ncbi:MAG: DUF4421 domain-containing protein [Bacteroidales bacterium]|nr:DUF4421 domain-containing protein [Bacteroidales bacterium]
MRKWIPILTILCLTAPLLSAQQTGWLGRTVRSVSKALTTPSRTFDTTYVYQLETPWVVSLNLNLISTGFGMQTDISSPSTGEATTRVTSHLRQPLYQKVGGGLTYGSLRVAYGAEIAPRSKARNKYNRVVFIRPRFGVSFQYYKINDYLDGETRSLESTQAAPTGFSSQYPGQMRSLVTDFFYFFNPDRFTYAAVTNLNLIQRRSGGSWMATVRYSQGEFQFDIRDALVQESRDHIGRLRNGELTLGGGYSYNWVLLHRSPNGRSFKGMRNLTLNATFVPALSVYSHQHATPYLYPTADAGLTGDVTEGKEVRNYRAFPGLNLAARAGISYSWDRFFLCSTVTFNRSYFRDVQGHSVDGQTHNQYFTRTGGTFYDLSACLQFNVRF